MNTNIDRWVKRNSSIELLKIIAIFLIVISHVVQTLSSNNSYVTFHDYYLDLSTVTTSFQMFLLSLLRYLGAFGNTIFFLCSAWFFQQTTTFDKKKWMSLFFEIWFISVAILFIVLIVRNGHISTAIIIKSFLPTTFGNNWYMTCYLLFYPLCPILNGIINSLDKRDLFRVAIVLMLINCVLCFAINNVLYSSHLTLWIALYSILSYLVRYKKDFLDSVKMQVVIIIIGMLGLIAIVSITNVLGLHVSYFENKLLRWDTNNNPFIITVSFGLFNLIRKLSFRNRIINYISSLSLLVYLIHENIIIRNYYRPIMWEYVYQNYGYEHILIYVLLLSFIVFALGLIVSVIYDKTIRRLVKNIAERLFSVIRRGWLVLERRLD